MKNKLLILWIFFGVTGWFNALAENPTNNYPTDITAMVKIPTGYYSSFLKAKGQPDRIKVHTFYLDVHAVTNAQFLAFVKANPKWARSKVSRLFADENYLKNWAGDFDLGSCDPNSPVVNVSWFAATAYAQWCGKRLPTLHEWEYVASGAAVNLPKGEQLTEFILSWYSRPAVTYLPPVESTYKNQFGVYDMYGLIWEWVEDFNSVITSGGGVAGKGFYCAAASLNAVNKKDYAAFIRFAFRESLKAAYTVTSLGFRCAKDIQ